MGILTCFWGKKQRLRRIEADDRVRQKNRDRSSTEASTTSKSHSLRIQITSPTKEVYAYEEPCRPKSAVSGSSHGSKLFKRKSVRRAKSFGSSTAFENGAKRLFDKNADGRPKVPMDRLQEEIEGLRKKLAEEEEEARKLRHEVSHLRSCGVLQSPDRYRNCCTFEKESLLPRHDKSQRNSQSWLGLTLSPQSRLKLEEHLRRMAADEMSKVADKDLTTGQKALIVATRLWHYQDEPQQTKDEVVDAYVTDGDSFAGGSALRRQLLSVGATSNKVSEETECADYQSNLRSPVLSFRDDQKYSEDSSSTSTARDLMSSPSTCYGTEDFSFHPATSGDAFKARQTFLGKPPVKDITGKHKSWLVVEEEKSELPIPRTSSQLSTVAGFQNSDSDHGQARRFIDLRYQELEEKLLKSPKRGSTRGDSMAVCSFPPESRSPQQDGVEMSKGEALHMPCDVNCSEIQSLGNEAATVSMDNSASACGSIMKPFIACKSGRLWQPLSPIREADSSQASREDLENMCRSQDHVCDSADGANTRDSESSVRSTSDSRWGQEDVGHTIDDIGEVPDDDLFTLSPRRLHHDYNTWYDDQSFDEEVLDEYKLVVSVDSAGLVAISSEEADFDHLAPIQCQSPAFSPKQKSSRKRFEKDLKVEYVRDKYFQEMGFKVEEFLSLDSLSVPSEFPGSEKENHDLTDSPSAVSLGHLTMVGPPKESSPAVKKVMMASDFTNSQDHDHPVLASIENLQEWGGCLGVPAACVDKDSQHEPTQVLETEEIVEQLKATPEAAAFQAEMSADPHHEEDSELGMCHREAKSHDLLIVEFSNKEGTLHITGGNFNLPEMENGRLSLHACVHQDGHALDNTCSSPQILDPEIAVVCHEDNDGWKVAMERTLILDNDVRQDMQLSGYSLQSFSFDESPQSTDLSFKSCSHVGGDPEVSSVTSRDGDETFHDCESPTHLESNIEAARCDGPSVRTSPVVDGLKTSKLSTPIQEASPVRRTPDISPDDRPILGTVATYWVEHNTSKSRRQWDGQGIPNSTTKFKEDQKVNWHTTPFETRLEQALATQPIVSELSVQLPPQNGNEEGALM